MKISIIITCLIAFKMAAGVTAQATDELTNLTTMEKQLQQYRTELLQLKDSDNPIAIDKQFREINTELRNNYFGHKIGWNFKVSKITRQGRTTYNTPDIAVPATLTAECTIKGIKLDNPKLIVGINISENYAAVFHVGNTIYLIGDLRRCELDEDYYPDFNIENVQVMENNRPFIPIPEIKATIIEAMAKKAALDASAKPLDPTISTPLLTPTNPPQSRVKSNKYLAQCSMLTLDNTYTFVGYPGIDETLEMAIIKAVRSVPAIEGHCTVRLSLFGPTGRKYVVTGTGETLPGAANMAAASIQYGRNQHIN